jgi:MraZ protein
MQQPLARGSVIRGYFSGTYVNGVDSKYRLSVPAPLRETIEARSQVKALVLGPSEHAPCLVGYDVTHFERVQARLADEFAGDFGPARSVKARTLFGLTEQLKYDDTGRIILSSTMRDMAELGSELGGQAVFLGVGDYFELWAPEQLFAQADQDPRLVKTVKALLAGKAA